MNALHNRRMFTDKPQPRRTYLWQRPDWPVEVQASGGRSDRGDYIDQNFDHYSCCLLYTSRCV